MNDEPRPVLLVLDTSAILAYARGSIHVGEPIAEVANDGGVAGLPVPCVAEARWMVADLDRLKMLIGHHATELVASPEDWSSLADAVESGTPSGIPPFINSAGSLSRSSQR
jgi:hypothetical protein